ncbi:selenide, water dikinase SelD, partial [Actinoalloteichus caeruleus]
PVLAVNLLGWPKALPADQAAQLLQGGLDVARDAGCQLGGTHPLGDDRPAYGLSVTGAGRPDAVLGTDAGVAGMPLTLTKPLGSGVLTRRHRATGEYFPQAVASMTALNHRAAEEALANGARGAVEVGDYGLLGHAYLLARASGVTVVLDSAALPFLDGARTSPAHADCPRARRVLGWLGQHLVADGLPEEDALLLADPQISGGLLVAGEVPGFPVVGELLPRGEEAVAIR